MSQNKTKADKFADLRRQAEAAAPDQGVNPAGLSADDIHQLVHDLHVHQIELELQSEELRRIQLELEASRDRYANLYDFAPVGYLTLSQKGLILVANLTSAAMLRVARGDLLRRSLSTFIVKQDQDSYYLYRRQLFNTPTPQVCEIRLVRKDPSPFYARLEATVAQDRGNDPPVCRVALSDITQRKRGEEALRQSEARLESIISAATDAIITIDANQRIILFNATAEQVFQYQADGVIGQPLDLLLPERFRAVHARHVQHFGQTGVTARRMGAMPGELWGRRADGEEFPIEAMISQVEVSGQKFYTVILRDITQRKRTEAEKERLFQEVSQQREQLRALTRQLAEAQEVERKELARELHDRVGQKLTALGLNLNLIWAQLAETALGAGPIQARLDDSLALVAEMTEHIRDVMANLRPPVLDDYGLVAALHWYGSQLAPRVSFTITVQGEEPAPRLAAPVENALFRIAQEALTNVAKHARASQVMVTVRADNETVRLVIVDDGIGFEPVRQAERVERQGWGLITMIERAEAVGGHCHIKSRPGQGTQVIVEVAR